MLRLEGTMDPSNLGSATSFDRDTGTLTINCDVSFHPSLVFTKAVKKIMMPKNDIVQPLSWGTLDLKWNVIVRNIKFV